MENKVSPHLLEPDGTPMTTIIKDEFLGIELPYVYEGYDTIVQWAQLTRGTNMALRPETTGKITRYLLDLGRWNTFEGIESDGYLSYITEFSGVHRELWLLLRNWPRRKWDAPRSYWLWQQAGTYPPPGQPVLADG